MMLKLLPTIAALLLTAAAAQAQTEASSPAQQRAASRRALREAQHTETPYTESHLGKTHHQLKRGESAPVPPVSGEPKFDRDGTPHVTEPKYPGLRLRKQKKDSSN
jgi:hypothetical protein